MIICIFELFTMHLRFTTLKRFSLSNVQYLPQKSQNSKTATDLKAEVTVVELLRSCMILNNVLNPYTNTQL